MDEVVCRRAGEGVAQAVLAAVEADQFDFGAGQIAVGGQSRKRLPDSRGATQASATV